MNIVFASVQKERNIALLVFALINVIIIDIEVSNVSDIIGKQLSTRPGVIVFTILATAYLTIQILILRYVKNRSSIIRIKSNSLNIINRIVSIAQYVFIVVFLILILQIIFYSEYYVVWLIIVLGLTNFLGIIVMSLLAKWLFVWYKAKKDLSILLYVVSCILFSITAATAILFMGTILSSKPSSIFPNPQVYFPSFEASSAMGFLNYIYYFGGIISFITMWVATVLLLRYYSRRIGKMKYWLICGAPLAFFLGQLFINILYLLTPANTFNIQDQLILIFYYSIVFTLSSTVGGILFGLPFWMAAKNIQSYDTKKGNIKEYMNICGYGMALFWASGSATVVQTPYPPFGLVSIALIGISSYLLLVGLYFSAISVSHDTTLRKSIRRFALEETKLLDNIGSGQIEQEINKRVRMLAERIATSEMSSQLGKEFNEQSLDNDELKEYFVQVLDEIKKERKE